MICSPNSHDDQAPESAMASGEELSRMHRQTEHDDPDSLSLGNVNQDPDQLHQDDRGVQEVHHLLKDEEVIDVGFVASCVIRVLSKLGRFTVSSLPKPVVL